MQTQTTTTTRGAAFAGFGRLLTILALLTAGAAQANNIAVTNVKWVAGTEVESSVKFDLAWDNSWRAEWSETAGNNVTDAELPVENWDAAWVFVKFRQIGNDGYAHATLSTNAADHAMPAGATNTVGLTDGKGVGVFIYRNAPGNGANAFTSVQLRWLHASNGVVETNTVDLQVHAIEMVYVGPGAFNAGSGGGEVSAFTSTVIITNDATVAGGYPTGPGTLTGTYATWPNGYNAFYCMKYEITQGQYADFLNALSSDDASARFPNQYGNYRHTITNVGIVYSATRPDRACNYISWWDGAVYAEWSGLRPMTELEFEKACRGPRKPLINEYAWGTAEIMSSAKTLSGAEDGTETNSIDQSAGAAHYANVTISGGDGGSGPLRVGIFAKLGSARSASGASYWGIMELSGNLWERPVTIGTADGRNFQGTHGAGTLIPPANWPQSGVSGAGFRGGNWITASVYARASDRGSAAIVHAARYGLNGGRAVRSAPSGVGP